MENHHLKYCGVRNHNFFKLLINLKSTIWPIYSIRIRLDGHLYVGLVAPYLANISRSILEERGSEPVPFSFLPLALVLQRQAGIRECVGSKSTTLAVFKLSDVFGPITMEERPFPLLLVLETARNSLTRSLQALFENKS